MKAGWKVKHLEECLERIRVPAKIPRSQFQDSGTYPIISQESDFINGHWDEPADVCILPRPAIIFGDHTQVLKYVDFNFVVGADGVKVLVPCAFIEPKYLFYFLMANRAPSLGYARHWRHVAELEVGFPGLEEQQRIVAVLDEAFEGLDRARAHAHANLQNASELLANLINTTMNAAGADNVRQLGELCRFENGDRGKNYPGRKAFVPMGVPFINAGHLLNGPIDWASMNFIPEEHYHRLSNGKVKQGDLLFCLRGSLGKFGVVDTDEAGAIASSLVIVRPSEKLLGDYLSAYFESKACADMIAEYAGGAAQPNLSAKSLAAFKIALPSLEEQRRVVTSISETRKSVEALIVEYKTKLQDLDDLRQSLLQKAFAGELT